MAKNLAKKNKTLTLDEAALDDVLYQHDVNGGEEGGILALQHSRDQFCTVSEGPNEYRYLCLVTSLYRTRRFLYVQGICPVI